MLQIICCFVALLALKGALQHLDFNYEHRFCRNGWPLFVVTIPVFLVKQFWGLCDV